ncbi:MAG TPA: glycosyltransferase [Kofleriaceae bacterium]|nr:glycosyltransferase [Kofleriaceae bacterium]
MVKRVFFFRPTLDDGGADRVTLTLLQNLDRARFRPTLVLVRRRGALMAELPPDVPVVELGAARLATSGIALRRLLRAERPDVLFSTASVANIPAAAAHRAAGARGRLVLSERSTLYRGHGRLHARQSAMVALKRLTYRFADLVTAVSQGVADELARVLGLAAARIKVVYNPMVTDEVDALAAAPVEHRWLGAGPGAGGREHPVIVAVGRLIDIKDYPTLLDAFARIRQDVAAARLIILGNGPERARLVELARGLGLADAVDFAGFDPNPFKYMARARLLLQSSTVEGLPGSIIQSMACGTPVVSTDCDHGPREVIQESGRDGFLVPVSDSAALADRALALLRSPELRDRMGAAARLSVQRFSVAESVARYQDAIGGGPG